MKRPGTVLFALCCLAAAPLLAQPQIGGNTCSSSTVTGTYAFSLTGRQVTAAGNFTAALEGNGAATFDGQNKVNVTLTTDTISTAATPLTWAGTYSIQANCEGLVTITTGGSFTLNMVLYGTGSSGVAPTFLVTGNDATYSYSGTGNIVPTNPCSTGTLVGVYTFNGTGYNISGSVINGAATAVGLLQFDGAGNITANLSSGNFTGTYSLSTNCLGSATLSGGSKGTFNMSFSVTTANTTSVADLYATLAQSAHLMLSGNAHAVYGQPTPTAALHETDATPAELFASLMSAAVMGRRI
jgi:hypothetical protein